MYTSDLRDIVIRKERNALLYGDKSKARFIAMEMINDLIIKAKMQNFGSMDKQADKQAIEHTRVYRESWIIPQLELLKKAMSCKVI